MAHECFRKTDDRQTEGFATTYNEREREFTTFTFAKNSEFTANSRH